MISTAIMTLSLMLPALDSTASTFDTPPAEASTAAPAYDRDVAAFCDYAEASGQARSASLLWPALQASAGVLNAFDVQPGPDLGLHGRVMVGLSYSAAGAWRGITQQQQAQAQCARYRAESALRTLLERERNDISRAALAAKLAVLEDAVAQGQQTLVQARAALSQSAMTLGDLHALTLRLDGLLADVATTRAAVDGAAPAPRLPASIAVLLRMCADADAAVEGTDATLRQLEAWDVSLRGGYDYVTGAQERVPLYGAVVASVSLGALAVHGANEQAVASRRRWQPLAVGGVTERVMHLRHRLQATLAGHQQRLVDVERLLIALQEHVRLAQSVPGALSRSLADGMWFDLVRAQAERAYLHTRIGELTFLLRES